VNRYVSDDDIQVFLARNASKHESQISLIRSAVRFLWPEGAPREAAERVVVAALARPSIVCRDLGVSQADTSRT
jgi:hypothetical protein